MYTIIHDRIFWIYFIVTFFFIIIGVGSIIRSSDPYMLLISVLWILSNVALLILTYHAVIQWAPTTCNNDDIPICVIDYGSGCFEPNNRVWLFINLLFVILLVISTLWAAELGNSDSGPFRSLSGIMILFGGLLLCKLIGDRNFKYEVYITPFWVSVAYLIIWFGLTLYVILTSD